MCQSWTMSPCRRVCRGYCRGIIPRAVFELFAVLRDAAAEGTTAVVSCSYLQIYNDKLYDLLADRWVPPHWTCGPSWISIVVQPLCPQSAPIIAV